MAHQGGGGWPAWGGGRVGGWPAGEEVAGACGVGVWPVSIGRAGRRRGWSTLVARWGRGAGGGRRGIGRRGGRRGGGAGVVEWRTSGPAGECVTGIGAEWWHVGEEAREVARRPGAAREDTRRRGADGRGGSGREAVARLRGPARKVARRRGGGSASGSSRGGGAESSGGGVERRERGPGLGRGGNRGGAALGIGRGGGAASVGRWCGIEWRQRRGGREGAGVRASRGREEEDDGPYTRGL